jgi:hypothetical protein
MMDFYTYMNNGKSWNRNLLNLFWIIVSAIYIIVFHQTYEYIKSHVLIPLACISIVMVLLEIIYKWVKRFLDYLTISGSCLICYISMYNSFEHKFNP